MRASTKLISLERNFCHRARRIQSLTPHFRHRQPSWKDLFLFAHIVIELQNSWCNFTRAYYLSYPKRARTRTGNRITTGLSLNDQAALGLIINRYKPRATPKSDGFWHRRDEPPWHDPNVLITGCQLIHASNLGDVQAAFSSGTRVFIDLPVFRNFFAHRNNNTLRAATQLATQYGIPNIFRPHQILLHRALGRPQNLIDDWIDDLVFTAEYLCY